MCFARYDGMLSMIDHGLYVELGTDPWTTDAEKKIYRYLDNYRSSLAKVWTAGPSQR